MHILFNRFMFLILLCTLNSSAWSDGTWLERWRQNRISSKVVQTSGPLTAGDYTFSLQHQQITRYYQVHVPAQVAQGQAMPLVISLHGGGGNMRYQSTDAYYHLISASNQAGFIAVFPNGYSRFASGKLATWNAGICCGKALEAQIDDVGFIKKMMIELNTKANIDPKRIYANGMSNGGMMAYRLACELSETFAAIAAVAGTDGTQPCQPSHPVSVLHIHAKNDDHVQFNGGYGSQAKVQVNFASVPSTINKWVKLNACNTTPQRVLAVNGAYCELYSDCQRNTQVKLCVNETGGHAWPGGSKVRGNTEASSLNANALIWAFYQANPKP